MFHIGDIVRLKNDPARSPRRTRRVTGAHTDESGKQHLWLDRYLDGWGVWGAEHMELVERPAAVGQPVPDSTAPISVQVRSGRRP